MEEKIIFKNDIINLKDENFDIDNQLFWVQDIYDYIKDEYEVITMLDNIFIPKNERNQGKAHELIQSYIQENIGEDKLYFATAGMNKLEYSEDDYHNFTSRQWNTLFTILKYFYQSNGFINVNHLIGDYEDKEIYVYLNNASMKLIREVMINSGYAHLKFPTTKEE